MGADAADTLMSYLPPVGWADVATKQDLAALESRLDARFEAVDARFATLEARFDSKLDNKLDGLRVELYRAFAEQRGQLRTLFLGLVGLQMTAASLAVVLSRVL